jgi:hypothetical protein
MAQENPVPGPDTFDLTRYVEGKSTVPRFNHTVYLDQAAGAELEEAIQEAEHLAKRKREIQVKQNQRADSPSYSLVDDEAEELVLELGEIDSRVPVLDKRIKALSEQISGSGLTLIFEVPPAKKLGRVHRKAEQEYQKIHGKGKDSDLEYVTGRAEYVLLAQLQSFCVEMRTPDGSIVKPPEEGGFPRSGFESLLDRLIPSESLRLMTALNQAMDASADWAKKIDAGFPGGSPDMEREQVGDSRTEDGQELGSSSADTVPGA